MGALKKDYKPIPLPEKKSNSSVQTENVVQKAEIERMKKLLTEKIKDPKLAKKAAMILTEMLNSPTK